MGTLWKSRKRPFAEFQSAVEEHFGFLVSQFGFRKGEAKASAIDVVIEYAKGDADVGVGYERGCDPWAYLKVAIGDRRFEFGLHVLLEDELGDRSAMEGITGAREIQEKVELLGELVRKHATDLIEGDFSRVSRLRRLKARVVREESKAFYGTSTGETPRFSSRPTLSELFENTDNDGQWMARAYQAVWDYDYAVDEVARFLAVAESEVQQMLDTWDDVE